MKKFPGKIIFLSIDGILSTDAGVDYWLDSIGQIFDSEGFILFDKIAVDSFNKIILNTEAKIVLISSGFNKILSIDKLQEIFKRRNVLGEIIDSFEISSDYENAGENIKNWLLINGMPKSFVVLDVHVEDIEDYVSINNIVEIKPNLGIDNKSIYRKIISVLNTEINIASYKAENDNTLF